MTPAQKFSDFFTSRDLQDVEDQMDLLVKIAMTTDNGYFEEAAERKELYFFKEHLISCLSGAVEMAAQYEKKLLAKIDQMHLIKEQPAEKSLKMN